MWELDSKESWAPKNWCFWTVVLEKTIDSFLDSKIKPVNPKGIQSWIFIGRTVAEAEALKLYPPDTKNWLPRKDPDAGGEGDDRRWDGWMASLSRWTWVWVNSGSWWWAGRPWPAAVHGVVKRRTRLSDWTEMKEAKWLRSLNVFCSQ